MRRRKEKSAKSPADCSARPALVSLPTGLPSPRSLLPMDVLMHEVGSIYVLASDISSQSELAVFTKVLLNGPGANGPLETSHI